MGLAGFALTTFVLALINLNVRGVQTPNLVVGPALAYGGLVQLLGGMWEMASNNVFAATALSSYGGFWIGLGIIFTPGGFGIADAYGGMTPAFFTAVGFYLMGWFVFTVLMTLATVRSNLIFFLLFLTVAMAFLLLSLSFLDNTGTTPAMQNAILAHAGGGFAMIAAFLAWWTMYAGVANRENSFFLVPSQFACTLQVENGLGELMAALAFPFPWSPEGRSSRGRRAPP